MVRTVLQVGECVVCYMKARLRKITIVLCVCCVTTWTELSLFIFSHNLYTSFIFVLQNRSIRMLFLLYTVLCKNLYSKEFYGFYHIAYIAYSPIFLILYR